MKNNNKFKEIFETEILKSLGEGKIEGKSIKKLPALFKKDRKFIKYSKDELDYILRLNDLGVSYSVIAKFILRTEQAVRTQGKKLRLEKGTYNRKHIEEKYRNNIEFLCHLFLENKDVSSILDAFSGKKPFWTSYEKSLGMEVITNDINKEFAATYHIDAKELIKKLRESGKSFDIVDLDPFSSPVGCFEDAINICKRGLIMTFGDKRGIMSNKNLAKERYRCKRYDERLIINYFKREAKKFGVALKLYKLLKWGMTWRVYFTVSSIPYKCNV